MNKGYIYVLRNNSMPGLVKIGKTIHSGSKRADELSAHSGVALEFYVLFQILVKDIDKAEKLIHSLIDKYRISKRREFFECDTNELLSLITDEVIKKKLLVQEEKINISRKNDSSSISEIYFDLGYCQEKDGNFYEAIELYKKSISANPNNFQARIRRMCCVFEDNIFDDFHTPEETQSAINELTSLIKRNSDSKLYYFRGFFYEKAAREQDELGVQNMFDNYLHFAYVDYSSAIKQDETNFEFYISRAELYYDRKKERKEAENDFTKAINLNPNSPYLYHRRAKFYIHEGKYDEAIKDYEIIIKIFPENRHKFKYFEELGDLYIELKNYWYAVTCFENAMEKYPIYSGKYLAKISDIYFIQGKLSEAENRLLSAFKISPKGINFEERMAYIKLGKGEIREAIDYFIGIIEKTPIKYNKKIISELRTLYKENPLAFSENDILRIKLKIGI